MPLEQSARDVDLRVQALRYSSDPQIGALGRQVDARGGLLHVICRIMDAVDGRLRGK